MFVPFRLTSVSAIFAAAAMIPASHSTPMLENPVTPVGEHVELSPSHPAFGREIDAKNYIAAVEYRATVADLRREIAELHGGSILPGKVSTAGKDQYRQSRRLETSNFDIQRLEEHFKSPMERNFNVLPKAGAAPATPWPSSYWPTFMDGINAQWNPGQASPAEKYAKAFGLNVPDFERTVSQANGILSQQARRACATEEDCASLNDGSTCAKRQGEEKGFCVPKWFGICHAWAPAAMLETEPKCPVQVGDITFQPLDIKGLLTEIYDGAHVETVFTGARFNGKDNEPDNRDQYGRYRDPTQRDLGAGFFHVALTNILGLRNQSFIVDVAPGVEVWNHPVKSYEVLEAVELKPEDAAWDFFRTTTYPFNPVVQKIMYVKNRFKWVVESNEDGSLVPTGRVEASVKTFDHEYLLELDDMGNILGGEWVADSMLDHPDFLWFPAQKPAPDTISRVGLSYQKVSELLAKSIAAEC
jgi:hypothetical protein